MPLFYDNYFVPRGYAIVPSRHGRHGPLDGCADEGGASDISSIKAVIDWLNGRATAVDSTASRSRRTGPTATPA